MKWLKRSYVRTVRSEANVWTPQEDLILSLLVGTATHAQIAVRLGRSKGAVQLRASRKGYLSRGELREQAQTQAEAAQARRTRLLLTDPADLSAFCEIPTEKPVLPHPGGRTYHKDYMRSRRKQAPDGDLA